MFIVSFSKEDKETDNIYAYSLEYKYIQASISVIEAVLLFLPFHYKYPFELPK